MDNWFIGGLKVVFRWPIGGSVKRLREHDGKWVVADPTASPQNFLCKMKRLWISVGSIRNQLVSFVLNVPPKTFRERVS